MYYPAFRLQGYGFDEGMVFFFFFDAGTVKVQGDMNVRVQGDRDHCYDSAELRLPHDKIIRMRNVKSVNYIKNRAQSSL